MLGFKNKTSETADAEKDAAKKNPKRLAFRRHYQNLADLHFHQSSRSNYLDTSDFSLFHATGARHYCRGIS